MIPGDDQSAKAETPTAFYDLRAAIDEHDLLGRVAARCRAFVCVTFLPSPAAAVWLCHEFLKFESAFARCIGESFYFSVIKKTAAVKDDLVDLLREQTFRDRFPDFLR